MKNSAGFDGFLFSFSIREPLPFLWIDHQPAGKSVRF